MHVYRCAIDLTELTLQRWPAILRRNIVSVLKQPCVSSIKTKVEGAVKGEARTSDKAWSKAHVGVTLGCE
jgi:hypothetical protein